MVSLTDSRRYRILESAAKLSINPRFGDFGTQLLYLPPRTVKASESHGYAISYCDRRLTVLLCYTNRAFILLFETKVELTFQGKILKC